MKLTDLAPMERWVALEKDINIRSGLDVNVFDPKGYRISDLKNWANALCPAIKATDKGQSFICATAHMNLAALAMQRRQAVIEECDAGMVKILVPIFYRNLFAGAVGACGYLLDDGEVDSFLVHKLTDIAEEKIAELSEGIPSLTSAKAAEISRYIGEQIDRILSQADSQPV